MALYLVRHGQTDWNLERRFQSRTDIPLNQTGLAQARAIRDELRSRGVGFAAAYSSPLSRAVETARIILEGTDLIFKTEPLFIELEFGGFEGRLEAELREEYGEQYRVWRDSQYSLPPPAGGEDIISGSQRVMPALKPILPVAEQSDVMIVAHQAVNMAIKVAISGKTDVESAATYRQQNYEVDIWDTKSRCRQGMFSVVN